jgi:hypothetical protein
MTDLFAACAGFTAASVVAAVPPSVRRDVDAAGLVRREAADVVIDAGPWVPRVPARHLVPSLALLTPSPYSVRFELSVRPHRHARWSPWVGTVTLGEADFPFLPTSADGVRVDIDEYHVEPVDAVRLRARIRGSDVPAVSASPWLLTLSAHGEGGAMHARSTATECRALAVPARSQMQEAEGVRSRVCSPTSTAMVMEYLGVSTATSDLADAVYHAATDRYGLWPAAIKGAASHGVPGYLLRFPDWPTALWCLERGLPIVTSLRYGPGALTGAPMRETTGHLVVVTGVDTGHVLANDPAAATPLEVPCRYRQDEFVDAWLGGSGVGYVFFRR